MNSMWNCALWGARTLSIITPRYEDTGCNQAVYVRNENVIIYSQPSQKKRSQCSDGLAGLLAYGVYDTERRQALARFPDQLQRGAGPVEEAGGGGSRDRHAAVGVQPVW